MRFEIVVAIAAVVAAGAACSRAPSEPPSTDGAMARAPARAPGESTAAATGPGLQGPVDRAKAEQIGLLYARVRWAAYQPALATAFNEGRGQYRVVVGFDKRPDAASVFVRMTDGRVEGASLANEVR